MSKVLVVSFFTLVFLSSCVAKKEYVALEDKYNKTVAEKDELESKYGVIEARVAEYNSRINELKDVNTELKDANNIGLQQYDKVVLSANDKKRMKEALANVDPEELAKAKTLNDSINLILSKNLHQRVSDLGDEHSVGGDIGISIDDTVVMITIADNMLFKSGSYKLSDDANDFLSKLAEVINLEPAIEVIIEGHTDDSGVVSGAYLKDNWQLSVERSTAVVRSLIEDYNVQESQLIAAGRGSSRPIYDNDTPEGKAKNRRTRVVILPDLDKFYALLFAE